MPNYISAYELQQDRSLSWQQVIDLAEKGAICWKNNYGECVKNGFAQRKADAIAIWQHFVTFCAKTSIALDEVKKEKSARNDEVINASMRSEWLDKFIDSLSGADVIPEGIYGWETDDDYYITSLEDNTDEPNASCSALLIKYKITPNSDEARLVKLLENNWSTSLRRNIAKILPEHITPQTARNLFAGGGLPEVDTKEIDNEYETQCVLNKMIFQQLLYLFDVPEEMKTDEGIWQHLIKFNDENNSRFTFINLFFQHIYAKWLFFDADNLPERSPDQVDNLNNYALATEIKKRLDSSNLAITERRYCVALISRLRGEKLATAYRDAFPENDTKDPNNSCKQGHNYCQKAINIVKSKMGIIVPLNSIKGRA